MRARADDQHNSHIQRVREMGRVQEAEKSLHTSDALYKPDILSDLTLSFLSSLHMFIIQKFWKVNSEKYKKEVNWIIIPVLFSFIFCT